MTYIIAQGRGKNLLLELLCIISCKHTDQRPGNEGILCGVTSFSFFTLYILFVLGEIIKGESEGKTIKE